MPHLTVQISDGITIDDPKNLLNTLNQALWQSGVFSHATDIKARLIPVYASMVGTDDSHPENFVWLELRLMAGRDDDTKATLTKTLVQTAYDYLSKHQADHSPNSRKTSVQVCADVVELSGSYHKQKL